MKKRSLKKGIMAAAAFVMMLGVSVTASAFSKEASITSATDSQGNSVEATFTLDSQTNYDLTDQFGKYSEEEQKKFIAYYDCVDEWDIALDSYATGTLDLSKTGASAENPVTITFSLTEMDHGYGYVEAGWGWLYVLQQLEDGSCKLIHAQSSADRTITAQFTDAGESNIYFVALDLAREGIDPEYWEVADKTPSADGVQSAVDAAGNPVNVTVSPLDEDMKAIAARKASDQFKAAPIAMADVNLEGSNVSESNPITVTFLIAGVKEGDVISILHKKADGSWETLAGTTGNGTVTATFTSLSPVAFVRTGEAAATAPTTEAAPTTATATDGTNTQNIPKTGDKNALLVVILGMLCAASAGTFVYINKKRTA